jgi:transitional endoplasmic reticulum ATPase
VAEEIALKVKEALAKDVGRAFARLDPADMARLDLSVGEIVQLEGKRATAAKVLPCYPEERGKGIVQIDGITRENAQAGLEDRVRIRKSTAQPAARLVLASLDGVRLGKEQDARYVGSLLEGLPLIAGDRLRARLFGTRTNDFRVVSSTPEGVVFVHPKTSIKLQEEGGEGRSGRVSYEDIGGLGRQIRRIREMIELPLRYPEVFQRLGIDAPKGVLLHGPPGTGKTLIARAVAHETEAYFTHMSGPECMGKFYGESEARLRSLFEDAQAHAPAIIFIDEIDAIAPKREEMGGEKQVERRVVAQLLSLMDGLQGRGQIVVIGATNIPNTLDPALRRPGRFDRELSIPIPDRYGRLEILQVHTRGMPLAEDVSLEKLAEITHGFVGADLEALAREAAMAALRKILPSLDYTLAEIPYETLLSLQVTMEDFHEAMKEVEPSAIREFFVEVPDVRWEDVGGLEEAKQALQEAVEWPLRYADLFTKAGAKPPKGILLFGPPGSGKTLLAKAVAHQCGVNFISVQGPSLVSKYVGESERGVREVFHKAKQASPTILFFDEIDSLVPVRGSGSDSQTTERVISQFLVEMDGIEELKGVVVLAATNRLDRLDPALLRSGRFDLQVELTPPDLATRLAILVVHTRGKPLAEELSLAYLAEQSEGFVGADLEWVCRQAALLAIRQWVERDLSEEPLILQNEHFQAALEQTRARKLAGRSGESREGVFP